MSENLDESQRRCAELKVAVSQKIILCDDVRMTFGKDNSIVTENRSVAAGVRDRGKV